MGPGKEAIVAAPARDAADPLPPEIPSNRTCGFISPYVFLYRTPKGPRTARAFSLDLLSLRVET